MVHDHELEKLTPSPDTCSSAPIFLYGRQVPRLFYNHHCLLARPDSRYLPRLLNCSLPTVRITSSYHCFVEPISLHSSSQHIISTRETSPETHVHPLILAELRLILLKHWWQSPSHGRMFIQEEVDGYIRIGGRLV